MHTGHGMHVGTEDSEQELFFFPTREPIPRIKLRSAGLYLVSHLAALNVDFNTENLYAKKVFKVTKPSYHPAVKHLDKLTSLIFCYCAKCNYHHC